MSTIFTRKEFAVGVACALAFGVLSETASAQAVARQHAIVMDSTGKPVTSAKCHGELAAPIAQGIAPVAAPAALPVYENVVLDANVLFDSDKSALRPAGRDTLDQFVARIQGLEAQRIVACTQPDRHVFIEVSGTRVAK